MENKEDGKQQKKVSQDTALAHAEGLIDALLCDSIKKNLQLQTKKCFNIIKDDFLINFLKKKPINLCVVSNLFYF